MLRFSVLLFLLVVPVVFTTNTTTTPKTTTPTKVTTTPTKITTTPTKITTPKVTTPTTPKTTVAPSPNNSYNVTDKNDTCIMMKATTVLAITYENTTKKNVTAVINIPSDAKAEGSCGNTTQVLIINFFKDWSLEYTYTLKSGGSGDYDVSEIKLNYTFDSHLPDSLTPGKSRSVFSAPDNYLAADKGGRYVCDSKISVTLNETVVISTENFVSKAFMKGLNPNLKDGSVTECSADEDTSSVVPIAVGAALAGLVVIVLIAYLIGRKRSRKTGYESV